jgi:hypothetical protein
MTITNKRELLDARKLSRGDQVCFIYEDERYIFTVRNSHLDCETHRGDNGILLKLLLKGRGIDIKEYAAAYYGYPSRSGGWPEYKPGDFDAAFRLCLSMYTISDEGAVSSFPTAQTTLPSVHEYPHQHGFSPVFNVGDVVCLLSNQSVTGRVMRSDAVFMDVAWITGDADTIVKTAVRNLTEEHKSQSQTKKEYNEHLQTTFITEQGPIGSTGTGVQSRRCGTAIGGRYPGDEESSEGCYEQVRTRKVFGSILS